MGNFDMREVFLASQLLWLEIYINFQLVISFLNARIAMACEKSFRACIQGSLTWTILALLTAARASDVVVHFF